MNYEEAMRFWFGRVNYEQRSPRADDLKLDRMRGCWRGWAIRTNGCRIVHIAGSKGKGSTSADAGRRARARPAIAPACSPRRTWIASRNASGRWRADPPRRTDRACVEIEAGRAASPGRRRRLRHAADILRDRHRPGLSALRPPPRGRWPCSRSAWAAGSIRPTSAAAACRSSPASASITRSSSATRWRPSPREKAGIIKPGRPTISGATRRRGQERHCRTSAASAVPAGLSWTCDIRLPPSPGAYIGKNGDRDPEVEMSTRERKWPAVNWDCSAITRPPTPRSSVATVEELAPSRAARSPTSRWHRGLARRSTGRPAWKSSAAGR